MWRLWCVAFWWAVGVCVWFGLFLVSFFFHVWEFVRFVGVCRGVGVLDDVRVGCCSPPVWWFACLVCVCVCAYMHLYLSTFLRGVVAVVVGVLVYVSVSVYHRMCVCPCRAMVSC